MPMQLYEHQKQALEQTKVSEVAIEDWNQDRLDEFLS